MNQELSEKERSELEKSLFTVLMKFYERSKREYGYRGGQRFLPMLHENGAVETATRLVTSKDLASGIVHMFEHNGLHLTVEATIICEPWDRLFDDSVIEAAVKRLKDLNYKPSTTEYPLCERADSMLKRREKR